MGFEIFHAYLLCFVVGMGYTLISSLLSGFSHGNLDSSGDLDMGHGDLDGLDAGGDLDGTPGHGGFDTGDVDSGGHDLGHAHGDMHHAATFSPKSPLIIAMFLASFGGLGIIFDRGIRFPVFLSVPIALFGGLGLAALAFYLVVKMFAVTQSTSEPSAASLIGLDAEVIIGIDENKAGQIAYYAKGSRYTALARSEDGDTIPRRSEVTINRIVGNTFYVTEHADEKLRRLKDVDHDTAMDTEIYRHRDPDAETDTVTE